MLKDNLDPAHEIGENVTITDRSQLLSITPEYAKKIKSHRIENQVIDYDYRSLLDLLGELDSLYFHWCEVDCNTLKNVYGCSVLGFLDCALTSNDAIWLLERIKAWS